MVKRMVQPKKAKKPVITRATKSSIEYKYVGDEPIDVTVKGYVSALNWYNYFYDADHSKDWLIDYMKANDFSKSDIADVKRANKNFIPTTVGWNARMRLNGNVLDNDEYFQTRIQEAIALGRKERKEQEEAEKPKVNVQDRTKAKNSQIIADVEERFDELWLDFDIYDYLKNNEISVAAASSIKEFYEPQLIEINSDDPQVKEAYGKTLKTWQKFWTSFIADCDRFIGNVKATKVRKPREKKVKSAVDQVKNLKFAKDHGPLKIASINPAEIIGAKQLWTYHIKYKKLARFNAAGPDGLGVKGTTLIGFDEETSVQRTLRKPELVLGELLKAGKITLRKFLDDIKTNETKAGGRISGDMVLLRVIK